MACRDTQKSAKVKQYLNDTFPQSKIHTVKLDLRDNRSIEDLVSEMKAKGDNIDVLINNAGVACAMNDTKPESAREALETVPTILILELLWPYSSERKHATSDTWERQDTFRGRTHRQAKSIGKQLTKEQI